MRTDGAYLVLLTSEAESGRLFAITSSEVTIGRSKSCDIHIVDANMSRRHARIIETSGEYEIEDLGSRNGTFLNDKRIEGRYAVQSGDRIRFGLSASMRFQLVNHYDAPTSGKRPLVVEPWTPKSWTTRPATQQPNYEDRELLARTVAQLEEFPPLVTSWEVEHLKSLIADAQLGRRFILQGGDCAETLADCNPTIITNKLKILLQMSLVLTHASRRPVVRIGRFAGQYAKPRSKPTETRDGVELPSYLGDLVNRPEFTAEARRHDPRLLLSGYQHAAMTLNFIRALCDGGFSDLRRPEYFDLAMFDRAELPSEIREDYTRISQQIAEGLHLFRVFGEGDLSDHARVEFFTSHEGLNLVYESAHTRQVPRRDGYYCLSTHLPWIGERTRDIRGAHIEFFRGVQNPVGVKIGPSAVVADVLDLLKILNPRDEPGKIILIARMGVREVAAKLPPLLEGVKRARRRVLWVCDPMHANGTVTKTGLKTRRFEDILQELESTFDAHELAGTQLGGVHFELTGEDVTECIGAGLSEADLDTRYLTACDPRLNYRQAIEMVFRIARRLARTRQPSSLPPSYTPSSPTP